MTTTFTPPTTTESSDDFFFGRYQIPVGITILWDGSTFVERPYTWMGEFDGLAEGETYFLGGRTYEVDDVTAALLADAGFLPPLGYGLGLYGTGAYGGSH